MPRVETAFINPFSSVPTLNILCKYLNENGKPLHIAPETILSKAEEKLHSSTGILLKALAELEFYIIYKQEEKVFPEVPGKNYHETTPFAKFENLRNETLVTLANMSVATKYGHVEVGRWRSETGYEMEQHEIEFLPQNLSKTAENVTIAKWTIRNTCTKYGIAVSFSPKLALEHAGNGMHIHLCGLRKDKNIIADSKGNLTDVAKQMIGGILKFTPSLAAFGNTVPVSYLRFISPKESPMCICWGKRNRLALVRIPLWWNFRRKLEKTGSCMRTFELRSPDSSANLHLLLAAITLAVQYGFKHPKKAMKIAEDLNAEKMVKRNKRFKALPLSCSESAESLQRDRDCYEADDVFPKRVIDGVISKLESYGDRDLRKKMADKPEKIKEFLFKYMHCG